MGAKIFNEANRSFNRAEVRADFRHWLKMDAWTLDEAVALSLGRDPDRISWLEDVAPYTLISPVAKEFEKRRRLLSRALETGDLDKLMSPDNFLKWARKRILVLPTELRNVHVLKGGPALVMVTDSGNGPDKQQGGLISFIEAMQLLFGIQCTIENDPEDDPVNKVVASAGEPVARKFFALASACSMNSESPPDWLLFADWYCFTVIQEFRSEIDGSTAAVLEVEPGIVPEVIDSPSDACMKTEDWVLLARQIALKKMKELWYLDRRTLTQPVVAKFVENELHVRGALTKTGNKITDEYIRREAFTGSHWWKLVKSKNALTGKVEINKVCFPERQ